MTCLRGQCQTIVSSRFSQPRGIQGSRLPEPQDNVGSVCFAVTFCLPVILSAYPYTSSQYILMSTDTMEPQSDALIESIMQGLQDLLPQSELHQINAVQRST